ncbi:MAG: MFS transporter [Anaerolineales bacterium]|nr:MFS transporter [Anaerolineales bacterium]
MFTQIKETYNEFPRTFWTLVGASFIDRLGGTMIFPFFALYITQKFNVGMTQAGVLLAIFSVAGLVGSMIGGALTDKFGRRGMVLFGLVFSALSSVSMGLVNELSHFYLLAVFVGSLSNIAGPAHQAMVADLLPEQKRTEGFGILRVAGNLAWIFGPMIGGLVAGSSYLMLFILDAITSLIVAFIVFRSIPETKPQVSETEDKKTLAQTFIGYRVVLADRLYLVYLLVSMLMLIAYQQMYHTLSVYLRDSHGVPERGFGALLSIDAAIVVLLQFWVTRRVRDRPPMVMMAAGTALYMVGLTMFGFVSTYWLFVAAILLLTFGEMLVMPVSQALAARFATEDMRGRYMAFYSLAWAIPSTIGPWAAGLILDNYNPDWVWYAAGIACAIAVAGFLALHMSAQRRFAAVPVEETQRNSSS